jgi:hypothetical protein
LVAIKSISKSCNLLLRAWYAPFEGFPYKITSILTACLHCLKAKQFYILSIVSLLRSLSFALNSFLFSLDKVAIIACILPIYIVS